MMLGLCDVLNEPDAVAHTNTYCRHTHAHVEHGGRGATHIFGDKTGNVHYGIPRQSCAIGFMSVEVDAWHTGIIWWAWDETRRVVQCFLSRVVNGKFNLFKNTAHIRCSIFPPKCALPDPNFTLDTLNRCGTHIRNNMQECVRLVHILPFYFTTHDAHARAR